MKDLIKRILQEHINEQDRVKGSKWTKEEVEFEAKKYNKKNDFKKNSPLAYVAAKNNGWLDDVTKNMIQNKQWTYDEVIQIALKYNNVKDFKKYDNKAYNISKSRGWYYDVTSHMDREIHSDYTENELKDIASKYETIKDFYTNDNGAYYSALRKGILDDISKNLIRNKPIWTKEDVIKIANKYKTLKDFYTNDKTAYYVAVRHGWIDELTKNMIRIGNIYKRAVYAWEFPDKSVYVGLTLNLDRRQSEHLTSNELSPVNKHIKKTNLVPELKIISDKYINADDAINLENCTVEKYRNEGWNILNTAKTGGLGFCKVIWTYDAVKTEALKYNRPSEFKKLSKSAYESAVRNKWISDVTKHMIRKISWTKEMAKNIADNYVSFQEFVKNEPKAYSIIVKNKWLDLLEHLPRKIEKWDYNKVKQIASKYDNVGDFKKYDNKAYEAARKNGWFYEITSNMRRKYNNRENIIK